MTNNTFEVKLMTMEYYAQVYKIWSNTQGIGINNSDSEESIESYLERNPNLSFVCCQDDLIVGTILCGHDGRCGFIHHACVLPEYRGQGIGRILVEKALEGLKKQGIDKCHLLVFADNEAGNALWSKLGWKKRSDLNIYSKQI
ncbi:GNAT family N-acetyltransferase [Pseudobacteroides cellulosolvens]|uniref:GCN5-related N-acetyltransferase n=1 Tax=Pseudobacteroides cellulosolvens ATCC 35603 = DSM 2933 TaxID=398512 RepID=A0A0L6JRR4_9FIRM|nr:GNAT family N-acetyltransferase [Pseudobacteroides cellulosolvens]KNY28531.1 GCN5-related N-acetyltransferase [Pseudobacteroides cellulosolvens ATCC 35603 = DSM 2933]